jgi:dephospho-CoA kinase
MARRKWNEKDKEIIYKCKKYIIHSIRDLLIGIQIIKYEKIIDFKIANQYYYKIMNYNDDDDNDNNNNNDNKERNWNFYDKIFYQIYNNLKNEFESLCIIKNININDKKNFLFIIDFLINNNKNNNLNIIIILIIII